MEEKAEEEVTNERGEVRIEMETEPLLRMAPTYLSLELGREPRQASRCHSFVLAIFRILFYSTGLWGHQAWNYIPRFLFSAICVYRAAFVVSVCTDVCTVFVECHANNSVTPNYQTQKNANLMLAVAEVFSYHVFIVCLILAKRKDSALVTPSQSMMKLFDSAEIYLLFVAFSVLYIVSFSVACFFRIQQMTNLYKAAYITALLAQWAAANACNAFAFSSFALGKLRESFYFLVAWERFFVSLSPPPPPLPPLPSVSSVLFDQKQRFIHPATKGKLYLQTSVVSCCGIRVTHFRRK